MYIYMYIGIDGLIDVRKKNPRIMFERKTGLSPDFSFSTTLVYKKFWTSDKLPGEKLEDHPVECF